jgi:uncharacterized protein
MRIAGFDWDKGNWPKCGKHGVSQVEIEQLFLQGSVFVAPDPKHTTAAESRYIAAGRVDGKAMFVAFTFRGDFIRPISARYMHAKEARNYETNT